MEYLLLIFCMLAWGSIGLFVRFIPTSALMIAGWRAIIALPLLFYISRNQLKQWVGWIKQRSGKMLLFNGLLISLNWVLLFEAYNQTTIANATVTYYMGPIFMILISKYIFHKTITWAEIITCCIAFCGLLIIIASNLAIGYEHLLGILMGLGAGLCYGYIVASNATIKDVPYQSMTTIQIFMSAIIAVILIAWREPILIPQLNMVQWGLLITLGLIQTGLCYSIYYYVLPRVKLSTVAIISYLDPVSAIILGLLVFSEPIIGWQWMGILLILIAPLLGKQINTQ